MGRLHHRHRAEAQAAQAMASAGLLALAPVLFAGLLATVEPAIGAFYLRDPLGALCGTAALGLSGGGWWWMQRVVGRIEREAA
jgi:Flp pilus assembly protein TadB